MSLPCGCGCGQSLQAIAMVTIAIERYAPAPGCLTALHADLLQVRLSLLLALEPFSLFHSYAWLPSA